MLRLLLLAALAALPLAPAQAFFHGGGGGFGGGGFDRFGGGGFARPDAGGGGFARPDAGGFDRGGDTTRPTDYGGYSRTGSDSNNTVNVNRTTNVNAAPNGNYYHQPTTVNNYGSGCYNCGGGGWGAAAAGVTGLAVGTAVGAATANAYRPPVYAPGYVAAPAPAYGGLPPGCAWNAYAGKYACPGGGFYQPAYGANGVYYVPSGP